MNIWSSFLVAIGLSMDNLAVTIAAGCNRELRNQAHRLWQISLLFALAHFAMFAVGFQGGVLLHIGRMVGPWLACLILAGVGGHMLWQALHRTPADCRPHIFDSLKTQVFLALATSVDALLVGAGTAFGTIDFWQTAGILILCVFITSWVGFYLGNHLGHKLGYMMEATGGAVLIFLGVKVLLEGVGIW